MHVGLFCGRFSDRAWWVLRLVLIPELLSVTGKIDKIRKKIISVLGAARSHG